MPFLDRYRQQVALLVRVLPSIAAETCFALKGGTAINLFVRDMPRLSVDIDLTFVPISPRAAALMEIDAALKRIAASVKGTLPEVSTVSEVALRDEGCVTKLVILAPRAQVKIEVTPVLRGCVFAPEGRTVSPSVEDAFGFAEANVVSFADLYAGKIVAALDRQHPRDLFDVRALLANEGIDDMLRRAVVVYLLSHDRPLHEVLNPIRKNIEVEFARSFQGMTNEAIGIEELLEAREALVTRVVGEMPDELRRFLLSFERGTPEWPLLGLDGVAELPAIRWRRQNLGRLDPKKRAALAERLAVVLRP